MTELDTPKASQDNAHPKLVPDPGLNGEVLTMANRGGGGGGHRDPGTQEGGTHAWNIISPRLSPHPPLPLFWLQTLAHPLLRLHSPIAYFY